MNHPGPLMFDVLALPVRAFGGGAGTAIGVGLVNLAAAVIGTLFAFRRGGRGGGALAALSFAGLGWAAGSEPGTTLTTPRPRDAAVLACLFLAGRAVHLDTMALVWLISAWPRSWCSSTTAPPLFLYIVLSWPFAIIYIGARPPTSARNRAGSETAVGVVFLVLWIQPLIEQPLHGLDGNIARMIRASNALVETTPATGWGPISWRQL